MSQADTSLVQILNHWTAGQTPSNLEWQHLATEALKLPQWTKAFGLTPASVAELLQGRSPLENTSLSHLLPAVYTDILSLPSFHPPTKLHGEAEAISPSKILLSLVSLWLPFTLQLATLKQQLGRPVIQGILGGQGTGKTTLTEVLSVILAQLGYRTLSLSLDDLYKTYAERQQLQEQDPRLIWRGPPGTHDVDLGIELLDQLRQPNRPHPILVPRFDKSAWEGAGDRTTPEPVEGIDIVLFEGWFVGVRPINPAIFDDPTPPPIQTLADQAFARDMNQGLQDYLPLWERLDRLMLLYPTDYHLSQQWRRQAEQQMMATGKSGMTDSQIDRFVEYFWKSLHPELFITPLTKNPSYVNLVVEIDPDHTPGAIYQPSNS
ncbi:kinase [Allocoleopsis franciscana]|uniref:Putative kinase n=1 Tax=Allocoleopsis franciscana PCC 7113 TaxID=1173027 RepID=K9WNB3_9CYAN|nr:kinase [Allocoleopsis franciscana]AFZ21254.1 putative kinase [Allocoleopsis franciscana PCC 7113]